MSESNGIKKRIIFGIEIVTSAPLCVSSGHDEVTDNDLQRNFDGEVFVPGTSLVGAMRAYVEDENNSDKLFGYIEKETKDNNRRDSGKMSPLTCSDLTFEEGINLNTSERDGVGLEKKVARENAKFNVEIIETGAVGTFHFSLVIREEKQEEEWLELIKKIFFGIQQGEIRFGAKKNRGFGSFKIKKIFKKEFTKENIDEWIELGHNDTTVFKDENSKDLSKWITDQESQYIKIKVPLKLTGGISIRKYATGGDVDFEHITSGKKPVVPGTSWAGAIRERTREIADAIFNEEQKKQMMEDWFGFVKEVEETKKMEEEKQSSIVIRESHIQEGVDLIITRNKVNRFDNSTVDGALYTEKGHFKGKTNLEILIRKQKKHCHDAFIGLLLLVIQDLQKGYLAVGGQTSVGRGIFEGKLNDITIKEQSEEMKLSNDLYLNYINALKEYIGD